jgi:sterol desaturase/sphingolipid hydroxylase (fatty acid hydroxylase superfamily)
VTYWHWLAGISIAFVLFERLRPARPRQPVLRAQWVNDLGYLVLNGHVYALVAGGWAAALALRTRELLAPWLPFAEPDTGLAALPAAAQFLVYLVVSDLLQWGVHNLLHRVPWLWQFHKLHHSIRDMDWAGNFRFHWVELVVYGTLLYVPLALLGGDPGPLFAVAVLATFWGHLNHANVDVDLGPLARVLNSPRMHLWHHDASDEGGTAKNFGIVLCLWDRLFGTLYWPRDRAPARLGYPGDAEVPRDLPRQMLFPLTRARAGDERGSAR